MTMANLDSILNVIIPAGIFIAIIIFIYSKAQKPIDNFFRKIRNWLSEKQSEVSTNIEDYTLGYRRSDY